MKNTLWVLAVLLVGACENGRPSDPCEALCDGIVRCRQGNAQCVAAGQTARDPFMAECVAQCQATAEMLTETEREEAIACLDCLDAETNFGSCNGEELLDEICPETCRTGGALPFRDEFGPALFAKFGCLHNP